MGRYQRGCYNNFKYALVIQNEYEIYKGTVDQWKTEVNSAQKEDDEGKATPNWPKTTSGESYGTFALHYNDKELTYGNIDENEADKFVDIKTLSDIFMGAVIKDGDGKVFPFIDSNMRIKATDTGKYMTLYSEAAIRYSQEKGKDRMEVVVSKDTPKMADNNDRKSLMFEWMGAVDHFKEGKMYYATSVLHNGVNHAEDTDQETLGDYGVVRNNWYKFRLTDIKSIGTSVDKLEDPIVPNTVRTNDQINVTVDIIGWYYVLDVEVPA